MHWKKISQLVPEFADMGLTAMWLPRTFFSIVHRRSTLPERHRTAPTKAAGQDSVGYDVYDLYDLGEFDQKGGRRTNWGTKEELLDAVKKAKEHGIVTYVDAVLNHRRVFLPAFVSLIFMITPALVGSAQTGKRRSPSPRWTTKTATRKFPTCMT